MRTIHRTNGSFGVENNFLKKLGDLNKKMSDRVKIGGRAYANGVKLMTDRYAVKAYYNDEDQLEYKISRVEKGKILDFVHNIPVLRGIVSLLFAVGLFLQEGFRKPKKYWIVFLILFADIIYMYLAGTGGMIGNVVVIFYYSLPILLIFIFRKTIVKILKYHGAEHKTVHYYENDFEGEIDSYSRLHRRCGSNVVFYYLLISFSLGFLAINLNIYLQELIYLGLAYEIMKYIPDRLLFLPYLFQRLVTREPDDRHIKAAEFALKVLCKQDSQINPGNV